MHNIIVAVSDFIGLFGVGLILYAYFLISTGGMRANQFRYQLLNFTGAWLILFSLYFHWNLASVIIEIAWVMISILGMWRAIFSRQK